MPEPTSEQEMVDVGLSSTCAACAIQYVGDDERRLLKARRFRRLDDHEADPMMTDCFGIDEGALYALYGDPTPEEEMDNCVMPCLAGMPGWNATGNHTEMPYYDFDYGFMPYYVDCQAYCHDLDDHGCNGNADCAG